MRNFCTFVVNCTIVKSGAAREVSRIYIYIYVCTNIYIYIYIYINVVNLGSSSLVARLIRNLPPPEILQLMCSCRLAWSNWVWFVVSNSTTGVGSPSEILGQWKSNRIPTLRLATLDVCNARVWVHNNDAVAHCKFWWDIPPGCFRWLLQHLYNLVELHNLLDFRASHRLWSHTDVDHHVKSRLSWDPPHTSLKSGFSDSFRGAKARSDAVRLSDLMLLHIGSLLLILWCSVLHPLGSLSTSSFDFPVFCAK